MRTSTVHDLRPGAAVERHVHYPVFPGMQVAGAIAIHQDGTSISLMSRDPEFFRALAQHALHVVAALEQVALPKVEVPR